MKISIGSDHGGFELKEFIKKYLIEKGYEIEDEGCFSRESVDYPDYGKKVAKKVSVGEVPIGILSCKSGIGMSIVANRFKNVRAALCNNEESAYMSRAHNNANILVLGAQYITFDQASKILATWLSTEFEGGRHLRRITEIDNNN